MTSGWPYDVFFIVSFQITQTLVWYTFYSLTFGALWNIVPATQLVGTFSEIVEIMKTGFKWYPEITKE